MPKKTVAKKSPKKTARKTTVVKKVKKQTKAVRKNSRKKLSDFKVSLRDLVEAGCHFGHQVRRWNPKAAPFIWKAREGVHILDLIKTQKYLRDACLAARDLVTQGGTILFVGTKRQAGDIIKEEATKAGMPYVNIRWLGGTLSNWDQISKSIEKLIDMKKNRAAGEFKKYTKREQVMLDKEIVRLEYLFGGIENLKDIPDALFIVDSKKEKITVKEAKQEHLKIFAIVDSNADPTEIDWPIPANDDAIRSIKIIVTEFAKAVEEGVGLRKK